MGGKSKLRLEYEATHANKPTERVEAIQQLSYDSERTLKKIIQQDPDPGVRAVAIMQLPKLDYSAKGVKLYDVQKLRRFLGEILSKEIVPWVRKIIMLKIIFSIDPGKKLLPRLEAMNLFLVINETAKKDPSESVRKMASCIMNGQLPPLELILEGMPNEDKQEVETSNFSKLYKVFLEGKDICFDCSCVEPNRCIYCNKCLNCNSGYNNICFNCDYDD